jgi:hypothetical protein
MRFFSFLLAASSLASPAFADVLSPPPDDCAEGTMPIACHGPPTCRVVPCTSDGDCAPGFACVEASLCVVEHGCGGRLGTPRYEHASDDCDDTMRCPGDEGTFCQTRRVCRTPVVEMDAGGTDAGGTDAGDTDGGSLDSGTTSRDSGTTARDSGGGTRDSGGGTTTTDDGGGCCSVAGGGGFVGAAFVAFAIALFGLRGRRRAPRG